MLTLYVKPGERAYGFHNNTDQRMALTFPSQEALDAWFRWIVTPPWVQPICARYEADGAS